MNPNDLSVATRVPFRYGVSSGVLVGSATTTQPLTLDTDSQFEWHSVVGTSSADATTDFIQNNFTVLISNQNGPFFSKLPIPQEAICPQVFGGWVFKLPVILPPNYQLQFQFVDGGAGGTHLVELVGFRLILR